MNIGKAKQIHSIREVLSNLLTCKPWASILYVVLYEVVSRLAFSLSGYILYHSFFRKTCTAAFRISFCVWWLSKIAIKTFFLHLS